MKRSKDERNKQETAKRVEREMERRRRRRRGEDTDTDDEAEAVQAKEKSSRSKDKAGGGGGEGEAAKKKPLPTSADVEALMRRINEAYDKRFERDMREIEWERKKERRREAMD
jgi:hypothetical protein